MKILGFYNEFNNDYFGDWIWLYLFFLLAEVTLSIVIFKNIFPNYNWKGPKLNIDNEWEFDKNDI